MKTLSILVSLSLLLVLAGSAAGEYVQYKWVGGTSTAWTTNGNWSSTGTGARDGGGHQKHFGTNGTEGALADGVVTTFTNDAVLDAEVLASSGSSGDSGGGSNPTQVIAWWDNVGDDYNITIANGGTLGTGRLRIHRSESLDRGVTVAAGGWLRGYGVIMGSGDDARGQSGNIDIAGGKLTVAGILSAEDGYSLKPPQTLLGYGTVRMSVNNSINPELVIQSGAKVVMFGVPTKHSVFDTATTGYFDQGWVSLNGSTTGLSLDECGWNPITQTIDLDGTGWTTIVPEPATVAILGLGSLVLLRRRRHA